VFAHGLHRSLLSWFGLICSDQRVNAVGVCSLLLANQAVAFANMSLSCWTWRSLRRSSISSWRSAAFSAAEFWSAAAGVLSRALAARIQLNMLVSWQPNSRDSSRGLRPMATKSIICWRNCAGYAGFGLGILDSFFHNDKVSVKKGQLQY
jgi:hypothetical protein